jgi:hypothetical protein
VTELTRVANIHKLDGDYVYVGRPSMWGNPYKAAGATSRVAVIDKYRRYFLGRISDDAAFREATEALKGKTLGCHCKPKLCHADVIAAWCNGEL